MKISEGWMTAIRCALYFGIALLTPIAAAIGETAMYGYWPSSPVVASAALSGMVAGLVAVRAFLDGSNERYEARKRNGGTP